MDSVEEKSNESQTSFKKDNQLQKTITSQSQSEIIEEEYDDDYDEKYV